MSRPSQPSVRYLSKAAAQELWQDLLTKNQIPSNSMGVGVQIETSRDTCGLLDDGVLELHLPWGVGAGCGCMARLAL